MWWLSVAFAAEPSLAALDAACEKGDAAACTQAGIRYLGTPDRVGDLFAASARFEKACAAKDPIACRGLGILLTDERPPRDDLVRGATFLEQGCLERRDGPACAALGEIYLSRYQDPILAQRYWAHACNYGFAPACARPSQVAPASQVTTPAPTPKPAP